MSAEQERGQGKSAWIIPGTGIEEEMWDKAQGFPSGFTIKELRDAGFTEEEINRRRKIGEERTLRGQDPTYSRVKYRGQG